MTRMFTVSEANALLPEVQKRLTALRETHAAIMKLRPQVEPLLRGSDRGSAAGSRMVLLFARFEGQLAAVKALGVQVKDFESGLCDFPAIHQGRPILLCYRLGESAVEWWHELDTGFAGRRPVDELG